MPKKPKAVPIAPPPAAATFRSTAPITIAAAKEPYGWLGNMCGGYPIEYDGISYRSSEALFQCLRFPGDPEACEAIRSAKSPLYAKKRAIPRAIRLKMPICDAADLARMKFCLVLKLAQNPQLIAPLLETKGSDIIEDCSNRPDDTEIDRKNYFHGYPFWGAVGSDGTWVGNNALGKIWMTIRVELRKSGECVAVSPKGDKVIVRRDTPLGKGAFAEPPFTIVAPLSPAEEAKLKRCEARIEKGAKQVERGFVRMVEAMHVVYEKRLYRGGGRTFAKYFREKWKFERAHSYRLVHCGRLLQTMNGAVMKDLTSQAHFRPLLSAGDDTVINQAVARMTAWKKEEPAIEISPGVVAAAVAVVQDAPKSTVSSREFRVTNLDVLKLLTEAEAAVAADPKKATAALKELRAGIDRLQPKAKSGISWTKWTWNPLQGCKKVSAGCAFCYAATLLATRLQPRYPGLARKSGATDLKVSPYNFTGKVLLLLDALSEPLAVKVPHRIFVNSLSDLFYDKVPEWFVDEVFTVMEKASWHHFQLLTKRPEEMATYTTKRYATRPLPPNVWLGTTIEDQWAHDKRMPHMKNVKAAVRWLSCEPLLTGVKLDLKGINWVVVGGESGSGSEERKMQQAWALEIRDQCKKAVVPFFFKQWGDFGEDGKPNTSKEGEKDPPPQLDGTVYREYPVELP